jgi:hypothetical protein
VLEAQKYLEAKVDQTIARQDQIRARQNATQKGDDAQPIADGLASNQLSRDGSVSIRLPFAGL